MSVLSRLTHCTSQKLCFFKFCVNIIQLQLQLYWLIFSLKCESCNQMMMWLNLTQLIVKIKRGGSAPCTDLVTSVLITHFCRISALLTSARGHLRTCFALLFVLRGICELSTALWSRSLKVTEAVITGCLQPAETLPGTTTGRRQLWLKPPAKRNRNSSSRSTCYNLAVLFTVGLVVRFSFGLILFTIHPLSTWRNLFKQFLSVPNLMVRRLSGQLQVTADRRALVVSDTGVGGWSLFTDTSRFFSARQWSRITPDSASTTAEAPQTWLLPIFWPPRTSLRLSTLAKVRSSLGCERGSKAVLVSGC